MGFPMQILLLLLKEHKRLPFEEPLLTLGRQEVMCTYDQMMQMFAAAGVTPEPLPPGTYLGPIPGCGQAGQTNDVAFFGHLGLRAQTMDYSAFEGADLLHDMNLPLPDEHRGRFRTIIDSGTLEHVFDIRQALVNTADALAPGGRVLHLSPVNNYVNHGFWQFSPTMFFDYYEANGFADMTCELLIQPRDGAHLRPWTSFRYDPVEHFGINNFYSGVDTMLLALFSATKTAAATSGRLPIQAWYRKAYEGVRHVDRQYLFESNPAGGHDVRVKAFG